MDRDFEIVIRLGLDIAGERDLDRDTDCLLELGDMSLPLPLSISIRAFLGGMGRDNSTKENKIAT